MKAKLLLFTLLILMASSTATAKKNSGTDAITMVSYEQGWLDSYGTLALKNNTNSDIYDVQFQITYLDMNGRELDYQEYSRQVEIAPGKTRQVDIPAYEHERHYSYYKSDAYYPPHKFKIKYKLVSYNSAKETTKSVVKDSDRFYSDYSEGAYDNESRGGWFALLFSFLAIVLILVVIVGLYVLVASMARSRHRSVALWIIVSLVGSPFLAMIILAIIGDSDEGGGY